MLRAAPSARAGVVPAVGAMQRGARQQHAGIAGPPAASGPSAADHFPAYRRTRRGGPGTGAARRGLPRPRVLGLALRLAGLEPALTERVAVAAAVSVSPASGGAPRRTESGLPRRHVSLAVGQRRA